MGCIGPSFIHVFLLQNLAGYIIGAVQHLRRNKLADKETNFVAFSPQANDTD
jgi:hypothetical protein